MIQIIDYIIGAEGASLFIAWDWKGVPQEDMELAADVLMELLLQAGYICDYHHHGDADVAFYVDGFKNWVDLPSFLRDEVSNQMCINLIQEQFKQV
ncbi:hypothetical protein ACQKLP_23720 [Chitinophaga sp. NPDC101104]|uniref:hypothetical protein n=1 Tax=Chitinophaga sp. NPDC101104 TaxID=3390561 RepID=UPI003D074C32